MSKHQFNVMIDSGMRDSIRENAAQRGVSQATAGRDLLRAALVRAANPSADASEFHASAQAERMDKLERARDEQIEWTNKLIQRNKDYENVLVILIRELTNRGLIADIVQHGIEEDERKGERNYWMHLVDRLAETIVEETELQRGKVN